MSKETVHFFPAQHVGDADFGVIELVWSFDAENKSTAQVHMAMTDEPFDRDTIAVGAKRLRLRKGVAPAKVRW